MRIQCAESAGALRRPDDQQKACRRQQEEIMTASKRKTRKSDHLQESDSATDSSRAGTGEKRRMDAVSGETDPATRREMIAVAAYFRAERRGFRPGGELDDWSNAEEEIARRPQVPSARSGSN
jgi:Protein of unknown function (DUF2934)